MSSPRCTRRCVILASAQAAGRASMGPRHEPLVAGRGASVQVQVQVEPGPAILLLGDGVRTPRPRADTVPRHASVVCPDSQPAC